MVLVLNVPLQDIQAVELGRQGRGHGGAVRIGMLGQGARRAGGVAEGLQTHLQLAQHLAALAQRDGHGLHHLDIRQLDALIGHQVKADRLEPLADDLQARGGQQVVHVGHPAGQGVLDRNHAQGADAGLHALEGVLEGRIGLGLHVREGVPAGFVTVGAQFALEGDLQFAHAGPLLLARRGGARALQVGGGIHRDRRFVDSRGPDLHPQLQGAQLFQLLAQLQRRRRRGVELL